jgi:glycosyltransferase involved in cell wall biosynthesis
MHVLHITGKTSRQAGGLFEVVPGLANAMLELPGLEVSAIGIDDDNSAHDPTQWKCQLETLPAAHWAPHELLYSPKMLARAVSAQASLVVCHGLWTYHNWVALRWARRTGRPYMVVPHGMLDGVDLRKSRLKKWLARKLYVDPLVQGAACLRAISDSEVSSIRAFGASGPICRVPNGVNLPDTGPCEKPGWRLSLPREAKVLFYIGRINTKKGLPALIDAWAEIKRQDPSLAGDWHLVIAGWDQNGHEDSLKSQAQALGMNNSVHFVGPLFQAAKHAAFRCSNAFVLPSTSEGLPTVVLEAWAYNLPVLMTPECNIPEGFSSQAAVRIETRPGAIIHGLRTLFRLEEQQRREMGDKGRALVERAFSWPSIARNMLAVFNWMLGLAEKPAGILID